MIAGTTSSVSGCMQWCVWKTDMYLVWVRGRVLALRKDFVSVWSTLYVHVYNNYKCREYIICDNDNSAKCEEQKEVGMTQIETCIQKAYPPPPQKRKKKKEDKIPWLIN